MNTSRRTFIAAGTAGVAMLALASWLRGPQEPPAAAPHRALDADAATIFAAVAPVLLAGAWPQEPAAREIALRETLAGIDTAVAGLSPSSRKELGELVALLSLAPVRVGLAGIHGSWHTASPRTVRQFLDRCRTSPFLLLRAAYGALHSLTFAAWYGNPTSWPAIGYPGPPVLESPA